MITPRARNSQIIGGFELYLSEELYTTTRYNNFNTGPT